MRILAVIPVMDVGGAEVVTATLALAARDAGHDVVLASAGGFRADAVGEAGVAHMSVRLASRAPMDLVSSARTLRSSVRSSRTHLVHAHNVKASLVARAAVGRRVPILTTVHGVPADQVATAVRILKWSSRQVVAVSPYVAEQLEAHGFPAQRITVIENATEAVAGHPRREARTRLGIAPGQSVALCPARLVDQKRHDLLLEAWGALEGDDAVLLLAGDGPNRQRIEADVQALGLGDRVRVLGARDDVDWLLAAADLLVLPTDWEGLPISLLEAMGAGVPVVVSRVGGVVETLGEAVRLVEPNSAEALREGIADLLEDTKRRAAQVERAQRLVEERFGVPGMVAQYERLYEEMVGEGA